MVEGSVGTDSSHGPLATAPVGRRYTRILLWLVASVGALDLCMIGLGFADWHVFRHWSVAAGLALLGALAWDVVVRSTGPAGVSPLAWIAFPVSITLGIALLPFLVLSVCPELEGWLFRAEARYDAASGTIRISFPLAVERGGINVRLGATAIDDSWVRKSPEAFHWKDDQTLEIDARSIPGGEDRTRMPSTIDLNSIPGALRLRYKTGDEVPAQTIDLK